MTATDLEPLDDGVSRRVSRSPPARARSSASRRPVRGRCRRSSPTHEAAEAFEDTVRYWRGWLHHSIYRGRWREMVNRSALTLKLLTYRPNGRDRRRADHEPSRAARRRAQLGLPLHLDPRRRLLALRAPAARVHRGGRGVHALAHRPLPRVGRRRRRAAPDHVRRRRPGRPRGGDARPLRGLLRIGARADRKRRRRAAPARHLRRADRLGLPLQQVRRADLLRRLDGPREGARVAVRELGPGRRGHLGDARRPPALHVLAAHVVGGDRARDPDGPPARPPRRPRRVARRPATRSPRRS